MLRKTIIVLSLVGLAASVGLWPPSYLMPTFRTQHYQFFAQNGAVSVTWIAEPTQAVGLQITDEEGRLIEEEVEVPTGFSLLGYDPSVTTSWLPTYLFNRHHRFLLVPLWMLLVPCASAFWFLWWPQHRRRKRQKLGLCVKCGYDLRGSAERCPECGASFGEVMMFSRRRVFVPRFSGELEFRALPDDWAAALESRIQEGFLVRGNHSRSNYRICSSSKDSVTIRADDWWTAINVGLNEVRLRREGDRRITFEVSFWRWTGYAAMLGVIIFAPLLGIFLFTDWMKPWQPPNRLGMLGAWSIGIFFCLCWPWILTEFHKKPVARCLERILRETFTEAA